MKYLGQNVLITTLENKDLVALGQGIASLNKEVLDIKFAVVPNDKFDIVYCAIVITKE